MLASTCHCGVRIVLVGRDTWAHWDESGAPTCWSPRPETDDIGFQVATA